MMPEETFRSLLDQLDQLVALFDDHPDEIVQGQVAALLTAVDMLHREGLARVAEQVKECGGDELFQKVTSDPVVEILFGLYGLVDLDLPEEPAAPAAPPAASTDQILLQYGARARWVPVADIEQVREGSIISVEADEIKALLVNIGGEVYGFRNACAGTDLPLEMSRLRGHNLVCPWHGCEYDARSGRRADGGKGKLQVYPLALRGSSIELAVQASEPPAHKTGGGCGEAQCGCS